jgi:flagellar motor switch protein FliM
MSEAGEVLEQGEIDALLRGVNNSEVPVEAGTSVPGEVRPYDLAAQVRIMRGGLATLDLINERLLRLLRNGLYTLLRRSATLSVTPVRALRCSDYLQTLPTPTSINMVKLPPLHGTALFVLDAKLVSSLVDSFFGGRGRHVPMDGREFTGTESRIIQMLLKQAFADVQAAWAPVSSFQVEYLKSESNPQFVDAISAAETVLLNAFSVELDGGGGELCIVMPYSMIEPVCELLESNAHGAGADGGNSWAQTLRQELEEVAVELVPVLGKSQMTVKELLDLKVGDVVPCDFNGQLTLHAEGLPFVRGTYGASRGQQALKVTSRLAQRNKAGAGSGTLTP